ncbi:LysE family transporter [uncultured Sulfitobacter sp.]|uniref:LysE family transporter n=1 Tax=uncultured Sulfitobacter sp. TaxID=191468 RepID=UPI00344BB66D
MPCAKGGRTGAIKLRRGIAGLVGDGVFVGFANPLALVFFLSVFPAFVPPGTNGTGAVFFFVSAIVAS